MKVLKCSVLVHTLRGQLQLGHTMRLSSSCSEKAQRRNSEVCSNTLVKGASSRGKHGAVVALPQVVFSALSNFPSWVAEPPTTSIECCVCLCCELVKKGYSFHEMGTPNGWMLEGSSFEAEMTVTQWCANNWYTSLTQSRHCRRVCTQSNPFHPDEWSTECVPGSITYRDSSSCCSVFAMTWILGKL